MPRTEQLTGMLVDDTKGLFYRNRWASEEIIIHNIADRLKGYSPIIRMRVMLTCFELVGVLIVNLENAGEARGSDGARERRSEGERETEYAKPEMNLKSAELRALTSG